MALPVTIPNSFANATSSIPLSQLDANFNTLANAVNGIADGSESLSNVSITGGTVNVSALISTANVSVGDDLIFTGTGNRITGDFSNATLANRVMFQTSTTDSATVVDAIPNGTAISAYSNWYSSSSDPANASFSRFGTFGTTTRVESGSTGTGSYFPMTFYTGGSERLRIDTSGRVGIGTTSIGSPFCVQAAVTTGLGIDLRGNSGDDSYVRYVNNAYGAEIARVGTDGSSLIFTTGGSATERARIDSSGNLLVGKTSTTNTAIGCAFLQAGDAQFTQDTAGDGPLTQFININASVVNAYRFASFRINSGGTEKGTISYNTGTGQVNYNQTSDRRLKKNIQPSKEALSVIKQVEIVSFDMIDGGHTEYGVIAQDLETIFPEAVSPGNDGEEVEKAWGVDTSNLVPALIKAIQEQQTIIDSLKARIEALENNNV